MGVFSDTTLCHSSSDSDCSDSEKVRYLKAKYRGDPDRRYHVYKQDVLKNAGPTDNINVGTSGGFHMNILEEHVGKNVDNSRSSGTGMVGLIITIGTIIATLLGLAWVVRRVRHCRREDKALKREKMEARRRREERIEEITRDEDDFIVKVDTNRRAAKAMRASKNRAGPCVEDQAQAIRVARQLEEWGVNIGQPSAPAQERGVMAMAPCYPGEDGYGNNSFAMSRRAQQAFGEGYACRQDQERREREEREEEERAAGQ